MQVSDEEFEVVGGHLPPAGKVFSPGDEETVNGLSVHVLTTLGKRLKKVRVVRGQSP